jgi:hypothetical protein
MIQNNEWLTVLADVIIECVQSVTEGEPFDAEPWIMIEEAIGYGNTKKLFDDKDYFPVTQALDLYCHSAQHDRNDVNGVALDALGSLLQESVAIMKSGSHDFSLLLPAFEKR